MSAAYRHLGENLYMARLTQQVALVTGAGGGIGRRICARFLEEGAEVVALDLDLEAAREAVAPFPDRALAIRCDVTDGVAVRRAVAEAVARFGRVTVLCATAGGSTPADAPVTEAPEEEFWRAIRLDLFGTFLMCRHGIPELVRAGGGSVVTMASIVALIGVRRLSCYSAAKGGIVVLTRSMAIDHAENGVRVNAIAPGITLTPRVRKGIEAGRVSDALAARHLTGLVPPGDVAELAVFLAGPESRSITGQVYAVDGGASIA